MAGGSINWVSFNPLKCSGQSLPIQAVLVAKLLIFFVVLSKAPGGSHTIAPFLGIFELIPNPDTIRFVLKLGIAACCLLVLVNQLTQLALAYIGSTSLFIILWSRLNYSNNQVFLALLLILLALHIKKHKFWGVRWTIGLLYFGAGLNKLLTDSWQDGTVMRFWLQEDMQVWWLGTVQSIWDSPTLFTLIAWSVILIELSMAFLFLTPRFLKAGIVLGVLFHGGMLIVTGGVISHLFFYLMTASYLLFMSWPNPQTVTIKGNRHLQWLKFLDFDRRFNWDLNEENRLSLISSKNKVMGFQAMGKLLIHLPSLWLLAGATYSLYIFGWP